MLERLFKRFSTTPASERTSGPDAGALLDAALNHHRAGRLTEAETAYRDVLRVNPGSIDAMHFLGVVAYQRGRLDEAERLLSEALARSPNNAPALNNLGNVLDRQGRQDEAIASYSRAIALQADYVDAYTNLGAVRARRGELDEAIACYERALSLAPESPALCCALANARLGQGQLDEAAELCSRALGLNPDFALAHLLLGNVLRLRGAGGEAAACYRRAIAAKADFAEAHSALATALLEAGEFEEAIPVYRSAAALDPEAPDVHSNLGNALMQVGRLDDAMASCRRALALNPASSAALCNVGAILERQERPEEAIAYYEEAVRIDSRSAQVHYCLGNALIKVGRHARALEHFRSAVGLDEHHEDARWALAMCQVPPVYDAGERPEVYREAFSRELRQLEVRFAEGRARGGGAIGPHQPFYLAYQPEDNRALLERFGNLCAGTMAKWLRQQGIVPRESGRAGSMVRVGVVSGHFRGGSVWEAVIEGWFRNLDRSRFSLHAFHLGSVHDEQTAIARSAASRFEDGARGLRQWVEVIAAAQLDALIYPEVGLDQLSLKLASLRLAPVQIASWGHPQTTGLPTVDYYLSAQGMEPEDAREHYTERLVTLPNLGCFYYYGAPDPSPELPRLDGLGLDSEVPFLLCPGTPFKYAPQFDRVFPAIARNLKRCQFVFFDFGTGDMSARLRQRLQDAFARESMALDEFVVFLPWQSRSVFRDLLKRAAVCLDTIGFSGFNTAMQAVECGAPIVAYEGRFLRGRFASGILRRLALPELVARSEEEYVAIASKLCRDEGYRAKMRARIESGRSALYEDITPVRALEAFLLEATH
jgi:predicted O-linked N-acetylglucosamine transferase (SPINDLY family)